MVVLSPELHYAVETEAEGSYNLAPELWFIGALPDGTAPQPALITREVMFWLEYRGAATPAGRVVGTPTIGGSVYEFWLEESIGKDANGAGWALLTFKGPRVERAGVLPLHEFLRYLVAEKLLSSDEYLASIEFGNEIVGGRGTTWVSELTVVPAE